MPRALVLFSGTDSVGRYLREQGWQTVTLDWNKRMKADICADIHEWDHKVYPPGHFDFVQASPDCTEYSAAMCTRARDLVKADKLVVRMWEILQYYRCPFWVENPAGNSCNLDRRPFMEPWNAFRTEVAYCNFGMPYRKRTSCWVARPLSDGCWEKVEFESRGKCPHRKHEKTAQHNEREKKNSQKELFVIPRELIAEIVNRAVPAIAA